MWVPVISILWTIVYLLRRKTNEKLIEASPYLNGKATSHLFDTRESEYFTTPYETESFPMGFTQRGTRKNEAISLPSTLRLGESRRISSCSIDDSFWYPSDIPRDESSLDLVYYHSVRHSRLQHL
ncbi:disks large 1 tumor suppressor protein-like isoform X1 [Vespula squamosa]|uniref:Disks large 1 tumor suppressor protein-like isoform X1 n=1 Tax=Vespula squamosa TaxID=30214 RepID=A0ABD2C7C2_VESSQ